MKKLIIIFLVLISCKSKNSEVLPIDSLGNSLVPTKNTISGKWKVESFEDLKRISKEISVEFKSETDNKGLFSFQGKNIVNFYQGKFELINSSILVYNLASTEIATSSIDGTLELEYLKRLSNANSWEFSANKTRLIIKTKDNKKLIFITNN